MSLLSHLSEFGIHTIEVKLSFVKGKYFLIKLSSLRTLISATKALNTTEPNVFNIKFLWIFVSWCFSGIYYRKNRLKPCNLLQQL
jgi:hypothetical protein